MLGIFSLWSSSWCWNQSQSFAWISYGRVCWRMYVVNKYFRFRFHLFYSVWSGPKSYPREKIHFCGFSGFSESEKTWFYEKISSGGFGITGCSRAMLANRISYSLGLTGPSYLLDTACSSSMYALDCAFSAIRNGECDAALVGGSNLILHPYVTLQFAR